MYKGYALAPPLVKRSDATMSTRRFEFIVYFFGLMPLALRESTRAAHGAQRRSGKLTDVQSATTVPRSFSGARETPRALTSNRSFDTDAQRQAFASLRSSPPVAGQLQR
jgi:hypothetical protein